MTFVSGELIFHSGNNIRFYTIWNSHAKCKYIRTSRAVGMCGGIIESVVESTLRSLSGKTILFAFCFLTENESQLRYNPLAHPIIECMYKCILRIYIRWRTPIAEVAPIAHPFNLRNVFLFHHPLVIYPCFEVFQEMFHPLVTLLNLTLVTILHIVVPRHHTEGCTPRHATSASRLPGCAKWHKTRARILCENHVIKPFCIECSCIEATHNHL